MAHPGHVTIVNRLRVKRGEVWLTRLDPTLGNEIQKTRPCLIVSPDLINLHLGTVIVMPYTSGGRPEPFRMMSAFDDVAGLLLGDQIRSVSKQRLIRRLGMVDAANLASALSVLREMFEE